MAVRLVARKAGGRGFIGRALRYAVVTFLSFRFISFYYYHYIAAATALPLLIASSSSFLLLLHRRLPLSVVPFTALFIWISSPVLLSSVVRLRKKKKNNKIKSLDARVRSLAFLVGRCCCCCYGYSLPQLPVPVCPHRSFLL